MKDQLNQIIGYLHGMWRYRWSALLISWLAAMVGWVTVLAMPDQYEAKAVIYLDTSSIMKPLLKGLAVETDDTAEIEVINRILLSRDNLISVIRETDMDLKVKSAEAMDKLAEKLAGSINLKGGGGKKPWEKKSNIYEISYQSDSAQRVYQVVSSLLNTMIEKLLNSNRTDTAVAQKFINSQIDEYEQRLTTAEKQLAAFKKENIGMMPDEKGGYYTRLKSAQEKSDTLRWQLRLAQQRLSELEKQLRGEKPVLDMKAYGSAGEDKLSKYKEQLNALLTKYTEQHPDVQRLKALIESYESGNQTPDVDTSGSDSANTSEFNPVYQDLKLEISKAKVEIEAYRLQLSEQERSVEQLKGLIDAIPEVEARLAEMNRDYEITKERYLELVDRRESARLAQLAGQSSSEVSVRVIEPPVVPLSPIGPNRPLLLLAALIGALGAGLAWCVLRYLLNPTITNAKQLKNEVEIPVFGTVSYFITPQNKRKRAFQLTAFMMVTFLLVVATGGLVWKQDIGVRVVREVKTNIVSDILKKIMTGSPGVNGKVM